MPKEGINPVEFPSMLAEEWCWFLELNASRTHGHSAPNPISEIEIFYYFRNRGVQVQVWQIDLIKKLDTVAMKANSENGN